MAVVRGNAEEAGTKAIASRFRVNRDKGHGVKMLDEELKEHRKKLEAAINRALTESPAINAAVQGVREAGYEVFLIVEATIGFSQKKEADGETDAAPRVRLQLTSQDEKFLRSLKISPE